MRPTTIAEEQAERATRTRWVQDQAFRDEFGGDQAAAIAYAKAEARGHTRNYGRANAVGVGRPTDARPDAGGAAQPGGGASGPGARQSLGRPEFIQYNRHDQDAGAVAIEVRLRREYETDTRLQRMYGSVEEYIASARRS